MQRTQLETFRQSRMVVVVDVVVDVVVVAVVVFVGAYSPVPGNRAHQLHDSTPRGDVGPTNSVVAHSDPLSCCSQHGGRRKSCCFSSVPPPSGGDSPPLKGSLTSPEKGFAGAIRVARLLLTLSSDVTATDDEAMKAFSTGSSSFAILNV